MSCLIRYAQLTQANDNLSLRSMQHTKKSHETHCVAEDKEMTHNSLCSSSQRNHIKLIAITFRQKRLATFLSLFVLPLISQKNV